MENDQTRETPADGGCCTDRVARGHRGPEPAGTVRREADGRASTTRCTCGPHESGAP